jgi:hypothetical protein
LGDKQVQIFRRDIGGQEHGSSEKNKAGKIANYCYSW